jgi:class 3 adenylate cyclase/tetratricopeptide (TPR) repeat protein
MAVSWLRDSPEQTWKAVEGSLAFVDISGFTALTEHLAKRGKVGAEHMSDILNAVFADLLSVAYRDGAGLVKWGGDAVLLLFEGDDHAERAARATYGMRERLKTVGQIGKGKGKVVLRMSVGIHSGTFHFFLVGDPDIHRELLISGPAASRCAEMEALASADEIGLTAAAAALIDPIHLGEPLGDGRLLATAPEFESDIVIARPSFTGVDLAGLLPTNIRTQLVERQGEAEHRKIGVAFVQFAGTDDFLANEGPEALAEALDECIRNVQHATTKYGVAFFETDINRDGGKIMITAGAPASGDHNDERILRATTEIAARIGRLPVRIGVNSGDVFSGDFGPSFRRTYSVKGDAINLAARLLGKAEHGQVVATMKVLDKSGVGFEIEPLAPFLVKGKTEPIHAARVGRPVDSVRAAMAKSTFVGRETELALLRDALAETAGGRGRLVELSGEPGIGKTRLVEQALSDVPHRIFATRCDEYEITTPYWPFRALLRNIAGVAEDDADHTVIQALTALVSSCDPTLQPWLPLVADTMDVQMASTPEVDALAEEFRKPRREDVVARFIAATLGTPTVLTIDDVHLMDDASADLLERISRDLGDSHRMVLVTRRDQDRGFNPSDHYPIVAIRPKPLTSDASKQFVANELADAAITSHDVSLIVQRASGNPLFLRGLIEAARNGERVDSLPDRVEDLITSQIDQLPPAERTVLRFASVLGVAFQETELRALLQDRPLPTSRASLRRLSYFIRQDGRGRYHFEHRLLRDTAYEGLPFRTRRELHGRAAELIETTSADTDDVAELLSMHFLHAKQPEKAWHYANIAGRRAAAKYAHGEAEELFTRAITAARGLLGVTDEEKAGAYIALADAQTDLGRTDEAVTNLNKARSRLTRDPVARASVYRRRASLERDSGRVPAALKSTRIGLRTVAFAESREAKVVTSALLATQSACFKHLGRHQQALEAAEQALATAELVGDVEAMGDANMAIYNELIYLGRRDLRFGIEALRLYQVCGSRHRQAHALNNLGFADWHDGNLDQALNRFRAAQDAARDSGDLYTGLLTTVNIAETLLELGKFEEAESLVRDSLPGLRAAQLHSFESAALRHLAHAQAELERPDDAMKSAETALALAIRTDDVEESIEALTMIAHLHVQTRSFEAAVSATYEAQKLIVDSGSDFALPATLRIRGVALIGLGAIEDARGTLDTALLHAERHSELELRKIAELLGQLQTE